MIILARVRAALTTLPSGAQWQQLLLELEWLAPILAVFGWAGGLVEPKPVDLLAFLRFAALAFFVPALTEEAIFRAALLPPPSSMPSRMD